MRDWEFAAHRSLFMRNKDSGVISHTSVAFDHKMGQWNRNFFKQVDSMGLVSCILHDSNPFQLFSYLMHPISPSTFNKIPQSKPMQITSIPTNEKSNLKKKKREKVYLISYNNNSNNSNPNSRPSKYFSCNFIPRINQSTCTNSTFSS
jgi:hypothetical protein